MLHYVIVWDIPEQLLSPEVTQCCYYSRKWVLGGGSTELRQQLFLIIHKDFSGCSTWQLGTFEVRFIHIRRLSTFPPSDGCF